MTQQGNAFPLVAILGPTASGKSHLAFRLAERLEGEVLACDSTQLYRSFNIGTAKPTETERRGVSHHLVDLYDPDEACSAGEYRRRAISVLNDLRERRKLPILTVGTGLYLRALLEGLADAPLRSEELRARLRARSAARGPGHLHRVLARLDREAAARIAPGDHQKLIRSIEVCVLTGKRLTDVHRSGRTPLEGFRPIQIGLMPSRAQLHRRIASRIALMLDRGWLEEVRELTARGIPKDCKAFQFIGYRELQAHVEGAICLAEAVARIERDTRRYAKRQMTWFRKVLGVRWFAGFGDDAGIQAEVARHLESELAEPSTRMPGR